MKPSIATAGTVAGGVLAAVAAIVAIIGESYVAGLLAGLSTLGWATALTPRKSNGVTDPQLVQRAITQAESGRKLAIYERDTGFLAYWYLQLRCAEECHRAQRYGHPLALVVVEPSQEHDEWTVQGEITGWLRKSAREADLIAYTGNGRFVVIMPETDRKGAEQLVSRLKKALGTADAAVSLFPEDGEVLTGLVTAAVSRLETHTPAQRARHVA